MGAVFFITVLITNWKSREAHLAGPPQMRVPYQTRPGARVVTSWTSHVLPSGSLKDKNDP